MRITILNGNPDSQNRLFDDYLGRLIQLLKASQHEVNLFMLREMDIRYCIGCFGCWLKTPGECIIDDDSRRICRAVIRSDFTLWASPIQMGLYSAVLKNMMDKTLPLLHPYFSVDHNGVHHRARYNHYPLLGLLLERGGDSDEEDIRIITDIFSRTTLNMKSRLAFIKLTDHPIEEVSRAITAETASNPILDLKIPFGRAVRINPPARLTVLNGSPRGSKGKTLLLLQQFLMGFTSDAGHSYEVLHLNRLKEMERFSQKFVEAECVLLGFPLYMDAMPGIVKAFIERLEPIRGRSGNPAVGFLVQGAFPEALHARYVERYLGKLAARLGCPYLGTIVKGGIEGMQMVPEFITRKWFETLVQIGKTFGEAGYFDTSLLRNLAQPERYPACLTPIIRLFFNTPLVLNHWDNRLKKNGAFEKRSAQPYI